MAADHPCMVRPVSVTPELDEFTLPEQHVLGPVSPPALFRSGEDPLPPPEGGWCTQRKFSKGGRVLDISESQFEQLAAGHEARQGSKRSSKAARGLAVAQELAHIEREQQLLKVDIVLERSSFSEAGSRKSTKVPHRPRPLDLGHTVFPGVDGVLPEVSERLQELADVVVVKKVKWKKDGLIAGAVALLCLFVLVVVCVWDPREPRHDVHHVRMNKYQAHLVAPLLAVSSTHDVVIPMEPGKPTAVLDIKIIVPCVDYCRARAGHRRLATAPTSGTVAWELRAGARTLKRHTLALSADDEAESFETVTPDLMGALPDEVLTVHLSTDSAEPLGVLCQVQQLGALGRHRVLLSALLFVFSFGLILSEKINRCYATFVGAFLALFLVCITYETPTVATVMAMIDFGTLMLLATMMMMVHILAVTGFFQWVAVRLAALAKGNSTVLFFVMANAMGWMSCILPNVTCVMLIGPITISLCKQMNLDPVPFYLAQTICSTVGGTTTMIGDPPNLVIGHKLRLKFIDFIIFNGPLIFVILPMTSGLLYLRFRKKVSGTVDIDIGKMKRENRIIDEQQFLFAATVFGFVTLGLFTSPIHEIRPCWFCLIGFFIMALSISPHHIKPYLQSVEWDTLLFFANLFVFVECLAELGLIKAVGSILADTIKGVEPSARLEVAVVLVLWVSTIGSAFLESLPYTTTMTYILADLKNSGSLGIPVQPLSWALSVGACVGGIGSIMGSSANLVSMAVSERYSPDNSIKGSDFLRYGFPTLLVITVVATGYQLLVFCVIKPYT